MSNDYDVLIQKFHNFKEFVVSTSANKKVIKDYENMSDAEFLLFGLGFLLPNKSKLDVIVAQMAVKCEISGNENMDKLKRYLVCFCDYLEQMNSPEMLEHSIINCATEKKINLSNKDI